MVALVVQLGVFTLSKQLLVKPQAWLPDVVTQDFSTFFCFDEHAGWLLCYVHSRHLSLYHLLLYHSTTLSTNHQPCTTRVCAAMQATGSRSWVEAFTACLENTTARASFAAISAVSDYVNPASRIEGVGEIELPIVPYDVQRLTLAGTSLSSNGRRIDGTQVSARNPKWDDWIPIRGPRRGAPAAGQAGRLDPTTGNLRLQHSQGAERLPRQLRGV